ncbi:MAG: formylmethanofuran dehydrogenase [Deltaproteobacteria bacterium]|nr:formylmethanofuran dehydrogenase [Candidatus Tharpella sp.]
MELAELLEIGMKFHGHKCPAMPLGLRAGVAAMKALGDVNRAQDKELFLVAETGKNHAAGCFLDGLMMATGCTYGKSNIEKLYYNKMAFTLIDINRQQAVRVSLKPDFFGQMMQSPFVMQRKNGILPQDIPAEIADPLVEKVMSLPVDDFLVIGSVENYEFKQEKGIFATACCSQCGERGFVNKLVDGPQGVICMGCLKKNAA